MSDCSKDIFACSMCGKKKKAKDFLDYREDVKDTFHYAYCDFCEKNTLWEIIWSSKVKE